MVRIPLLASVTGVLTLCVLEIGLIFDVKSGWFVREGSDP